MLKYILITIALIGFLFVSAKSKAQTHENRSVLYSQKINGHSCEFSKRILFDANGLRTLPFKLVATCSDKWVFCDHYPALINVPDIYECFDGEGGSLKTRKYGEAMNYLRKSLEEQLTPKKIVCAQSIEKPKKDKLLWLELERLSVSKRINKKISKIQRAEKSQDGVFINRDYYSIIIDKNGQSPAELLREVRLMLDDLLFPTSINEFSERFSPYDHEEKIKWHSDDFRGALMSFELASLPVTTIPPSIMPFPAPPSRMTFEKASVVASCVGSEDFVFTTVTTDSDGLHPVAGNRAFGVRDHGDKLEIFTKGYDSVVNEGVFWILSGSGSNFVFAGGDQIWNQFLKSLEKYYSHRSPRIINSFNVQMID